MVTNCATEISNRNVLIWNTGARGLENFEGVSETCILKTKANTDYENWPTNKNCMWFYVFSSAVRDRALRFNKIYFCEIVTLAVEEGFWIWMTLKWLFLIYYDFCSNSKVSGRFF